MATPRASLTRFWRWHVVLSAAGLLTGFFDAWFLGRSGISFAVNGSDATLLIGAYFGTSFAALGWLVAALLEARRRDRLAAQTIRDQGAAIDAARSRLAQSEKLAALGQLAAAIAHEVRNPLGVIRSAAQGLGESESVEALRASALCASQFIIAETDRLNSVIGSLLAFARPLQLHQRPVPVGELIDRALILANNDLGAKHIGIRCEIDDTVPPVHADPDLISQALLSLLHNAGEVLPHGGEVRLSARGNNGSVDIQVADSGPGVPPELRSRIFEPFFTTRPQGTGLGLAIVRQIIEAHGGRIDVSNGTTGGACFTLCLPAAIAVVPG
ncbi:MAG: hypothetical protein HY270_24555 [Deltaproteobacteria bacterium]|nr:hypothetical protein [Deltaproteobacteria bacterium]